MKNINLFKKFKELVRKYPVADISHYRTREDKKIKLSESIESWVYNEKEKNISNSLGPLERDHVSKLNRSHLDAVDAYITGGLEEGHDTGSRMVNTHLINAYKNNNKPNQTFEFGINKATNKPIKILHISHLDDALDQNKLNKPLTTYSGIGFDPRDVMDERNVLHIPAYTSSSTDREIANEYAESTQNSSTHILKITHPEGSTGLYIGNNEDLSPFGQSEHLSPRNMKISINPEPELHSCPSGRTLHIWHAKRITK